MDDFADKIQSLLSDPEGLEKIKNIAGLLAGKQSDASTEHVKDQSDSTPVQKNEPTDAISGLLSNIDPSLLLKLSGMLSGGFDRNDPKVGFLLALRPFLSEQRRNTLDTALNILKFSKIALMFTDGFGKKE